MKHYKNTLICLFIFMGMFAVNHSMAQCDQKRYQELIKEGDQFLSNKEPDYQQAMNSYSAAMTTCKDKMPEVQKKIITIFDKINQLKDKAEKQSGIALLREKESRTNELVAHSFLQLDKNPTLSFRLAEEAYRINPESKTVYKALLSSYYSEPFYSILYEANKSVNSAILTNDNNSLIFSVSRDIYVYDLNLSSGLIKKYKGHKNTVMCLGLSNDSKFFLSGGYEGMVGLGSIQDSSFKVFDAFDDIVTSVNFGYNNTKIISMSGKKAKVFSLDGKRTREFCFNDKVYCATTTTLGNILFFHGKQDSENKIIGKLTGYDNSGEIIFNYKWNSPDFISEATFSNNNKNIAISPSYNILNPKIYDLNGTKIHELKGSKYSISNVSFANNDKYAIGAAGGQIFMWDLKSNQPRISKVSHQRINSIKYDRDGNAFLVSCDDSTAKLVSLDGLVIQEYRGHNAKVKDAKFSNDNKMVITSGLDGTTKIYSINGTLLKSIPDVYGNIVLASTFSPNGKTIATVCPDWRINLYNSTGTNSNVFHWRNRQELNTSAGGSSGRWSNKTIIRDTLGNILDVFNWHKSYVNSADISGDNKYILTASNDSTAKLWDPSGNELQVFTGHDAPVRYATFSNNAENIITTGWDNTIRIWNLAGKELKKIYMPNNEKLIYAIFTHDDKYICSESYKNNQYDFNIDGELIATGEMWSIAYSPFVSSVEYSINGEHILAGSSIYGSLNIFSVDGKLLKTIWGNYGTYSPDGQYILSTVSFEVSLFDKNGVFIKRFNGHQKSVNKGCFSSDGSLIAATSNDYTARIWDLEGNEIVALKHDTIVMDAAFSPDDKYLTTVCNDGTITTWLIDPEMIIDRVNNEVNNGLTWKLDYETKNKYRIPLNNLDKIEVMSKKLAKYLESLAVSNQNLNLPVEFAESLSCLLDNNYHLNKIERIVFNRTKRYISSNCSDYSWNLLTRRKFETALAYAELAKDADPNVNILYTNLASSYLLNDKWEDAKEVYQIWQDSLYIYNGTEQLMRQGFLNDITELESKGIRHENFEKVRMLLGEEK